jgi:hypothetical protein
MNYQAPVGGIGTGALGGVSGMAAFSWGSAGWLLMAAFVLIMAAVAVFTIIPRQRHAMAAVNPSPVRDLSDPQNRS